MSNEAVHWAMDDAPMLRTATGKPDTTARHVLQALAEHAHKDGSNAHPSVVRIQYRTGYDRRTVQRVLRRLEDAKLISRDGTVQDRTRWRLSMHMIRPASDWDELERAEEADREATASRVRRHRQSKRVTHSASVTATDSASVTDHDVTHSASVSNALEQRYVTHSASVCNAPSAALTTNEPSAQPPVTKDSSSAPPLQGSPDEDLFGPLAAASEAVHERKAAEDLKAFGDFWLLYPKKKDRGEALKAWRAAVKSGVDPAHITAGAQRYANERASQDPKFTKYPATWLNKGCYDDEPDPEHQPAVSGANGHQTYRNPTDDSVWDEDLIK